MSSLTVRNDIRQTLAGAITATDVSAPFLETINKKVRDEDRPDEWITIEFLPGTEEQVSAGGEGQRLFRENGVAFIHTFTRAGRGDDRALEIADEVRAIFRAKRLPGGTVIENVSPPDTGDGDDNGRFFRATIEASYRLEIQA
jgi:hypothetical protein